ncbi:hypothetical protein A2W49_04685 [Candidatus Roizmanbacteria bacterium RIFCSPHIGHO2_12_41_18]|nr:MAG: hypothetical protein A3C31_04215 [Candidatus Roizmanbacteria bacterium RIFCSPHIGHO2_02_FULL_40_53]OGK29727.1 MAG: hypothetical protein A2W49_04685 [Candidatus Roizmanbacteria bacterium RIFCSPHIGHO2_12_41_18]
MSLSAHDERGSSGAQEANPSRVAQSKRSFDFRIYLPVAVSQTAIEFNWGCFLPHLHRKFMRYMMWIEVNNVL